MSDTIKSDICIFEDKICLECGECDQCEITPDKICDNCCECLELPQSDYAEIVIEDILLNTEDITKTTKKSNN